MKLARSVYFILLLKDKNTSKKNPDPKKPHPVDLQDALPAKVFMGNKVRTRIH